MFASHEIAAGQVLAGRYRIDATVGVGGMGTVYKGYDLDLNAAVAIKVLRHDLADDSTAIERFRQELLLSRRVSHANVVRLHDLVRDGQMSFITMDFIEGEPLSKCLDREGKLDADTATGIAAQVAAGLQAAHAQGIVHRDLKPANILIDHAGNAFITDFGIARSVSHAGLTRQGLLVGTPDYLSPEQAAGGAIDHRSDLYALGLVLCEMLTGKLPFNAVTAEEAISQRLARSPTPLNTQRDQVPASLVAICHRLLRRNVARRFQSASELIAALDGAPAGGRPLIGIAIAMLAVLGLGLLVWWAPWKQSGPGPQPVAVAPTVDVVAVLPFNTVDPAQGEALAAVMGLELARASELRVLDRIAVTDVLERLRISPDRTATHAQRLMQAMGADRLFAAEVDDQGVVQVTRLSTSEAPTAWSGSAALPLLEQTRTVAATITEGMSVALPPADVPTSLEASTGFFTGLQALEQGNALTALPALTNSTALDDTSHAAWWAMGRAHAALGQGTEAEAAVRRARRLAADQPGRYAILARALGAEYAGDFEQAERLLLEAVSQYPHDLSIKTLLAEFVGEGGEFDRALAMLTEVTEIDGERARAWFLMAKYSIVSGNARVAVDDYLVRALVINNRRGNLQGQADVVNAQGVAFDYLGQPLEAMEHFERAVRLRSDLGDARGQASTLRNLAALRAIQGDFIRAEEDLARARELLQALGDMDGLAALHNDQGFLSEERGDYRSALDSYREALRLRQQGQDMSAQAESHNNVGYCYYQLGEYDNALLYLQQALDILQTTGDTDGAVHTEQQLGLLHIVGGEWAQAETLLTGTLEVAEAQQMTEEYAVSSGFMAELDQLRGRYDDALQAMQAAAGRFEEIGDQRGQLEMAMVKASILLDLRDVAAAQDALSVVADVAPGNVEQAAKLSLIQARLSIAEGEVGQANEQLVVAAQQAQDSANPPVKLAVELEQLRLGPDRTFEQWVDLFARAEALGHIGLQLRIATAALTDAIDTDQSTAQIAPNVAAMAAEVEALLGRVGEYFAEPVLWRHIGRVCELDNMPGCQQYEQRRQQAIDRIGSSISAAHQPPWEQTDAA